MQKNQVDRFEFDGTPIVQGGVPTDSVIEQFDILKQTKAHQGVWSCINTFARLGTGADSVERAVVEANLKLAEIWGEV